MKMCKKCSTCIGNTICEILTYPNNGQCDIFIKLVEEKFTSLTGSQKLPTFEKVNEARFECSDPMLESVTKKQLRAVYDLICRQRRNEIEFFNRQQTKAKK